MPVGPYSDKVMEHFRNPRNVGEIEEPDGVGEVGNPACGDLMKITIRVKDERIVDASSMCTELVKGRTLKEAMEISNKAVAEALDGLPPLKMHCSNLAADGLHAAIEDYLRRKGKEGG